MNEMASSASNIYIVSVAVKYFTGYWFSVGKFVTMHKLLVRK